MATTSPPKQQIQSSSSSSQETYVCRFVLDSNKKLYLRSVWGTDHFSMFVTDGRYVWNGEASASFIESNMLIRGLEMDNFIRRSKAALITQDTSKKKYNYKVTQGDKLTDLEFTWFFRLGQTDIMARCMLPLARVSDGQQAQRIMQHILDFFVDRRSYLERQNHDLSDSNKTLKTQRDDALSQFSKLVEDKKKLETDLYKKFIMVLNEKKKKIRELKDALEHAQHARPTRREEAEEQEHLKVASDQENEEEDEETRFSPPKKKVTVASPASITFNSSDKPTPSLDLLYSDSVEFSTTIRKRFRPGESQSNKPDTGSNSNNNSNGNSNSASDSVKTNGKPLPKPVIDLKSAHTNGKADEPKHTQTPKKTVNSPFQTPRHKRKRHDESTDANDLIDELM